MRNTSVPCEKATPAGAGDRSRMFVRFAEGYLAGYSLEVDTSTLCRIGPGEYAVEVPTGLYRGLGGRTYRILSPVYYRGGERRVVVIDTADGAVHYHLPVNELEGELKYEYYT